MLATSAATLPIAIPMLLNLNCVRCSAFFQWTSKTLIHSMYIVSIISIAAVLEWAGSQKVYKIVPDKKHSSSASATSILSVKNCNIPMMLIIWCVPRTVTFWKKNCCNVLWWAPWVLIKKFKRIKSYVLPMYVKHHNSICNTESFHDLVMLMTVISYRSV